MRTKDRCELCGIEFFAPWHDRYVLGKDPPDMLSLDSDTAVCDSDTAVCISCCLSNITEAEESCHSKQDALKKVGLLYEDVAPMRK